LTAFLAALNALILFSAFQYITRADDFNLSGPTEQKPSHPALIQQKRNRPAAVFSPLRR